MTQYEELPPDAAEALANDGTAFVPARAAAFAGGGQCPPFNPGADNAGPPPVFYKADQLVTQKRFAEVVARLLDKFGGGEIVTPIDEDDPPTKPIVFQVRADSLGLTRELKSIAPELVAGPHHIMVLAPSPMIGPGSEPWPTAETWEAGPVVDKVPSIAVVDTGLWKSPAAAGLEDLQDKATNDDDPLDTQPADDLVDWYGGGHGGFITGVIRSRACNIEVIAENAFKGGELTEENVVTQVEQALAKSKSVILNLSLGSYRDEESGADLVFLEEAMARWKGLDLLIVAAAGNEGKANRFYPAAFAGDPRYEDCVVSVGALEAVKESTPPSDARPAEFSNYGPWVVAWAPGEGVVSHYPKGKGYRYRQRNADLSDPAVFKTGFAKWSGTSFAAPYVAAEIAKHAAATGTSAKEAWADLRQGRPFVVFWPDVAAHKTRSDVAKQSAL